MADFTADVSQLQSLQVELRGLANRAEGIAASIQSTGNDLGGIKSIANKGYPAKISTVQSAISKAAQGTSAASTRIGKIASTYNNCEIAAKSAISNAETTALGHLAGSSASVVTALGTLANGRGGTDGGVRPPNVFPLGIGALLVGLANTNGANKLLNPSSSGSFSEASGKTYAKWDFVKGDVDFGVESKCKVGLWKGSINMDDGSNSASASAEILTGGVKGSIKASLYKDGKLQPELSASAKAEINMVSGKVNAQKGDDNLNVHAEAEGKAGVASVKAEASVTDEGLKLEAGAEAYAVKGKLKGGIKVFGVKIDLSVEGGAGGASATVGGEVSTTKASGKLGAGLGLGAGIEVSIDWKDAAKSIYKYFRKK